MCFEGREVTESVTQSLRCSPAGSDLATDHEWTKSDVCRGASVEPTHPRVV